MAKALSYPPRYCTAKPVAVGPMMPEMLLRRWMKPLTPPTRVSGTSSWMVAQQDCTEPVSSMTAPAIRATAPAAPEAKFTASNAAAASASGTMVVSLRAASRFGMCR